MTAIAEGAAIAAAVLSGENTENDFFVSTEHALGTFAVNAATASLDFSQIIPKSHKLPAASTQTYYPVFEEQEVVMIEVVEGDPEQNDYVVLKEWTVPLLESDGDRGFELTYDYDVSGILRVRAVDIESGTVLLDDDVAYGVAEDKREIASMAQRARQAVATGQVNLEASTAPTSKLSPESEELLQKATQKVIPYLDSQNAAQLQTHVEALRSSDPASEAERQQGLRTALQSYSFLM